MSDSPERADAAEAVGVDELPLREAPPRDVARQEQERRWRTEHADFIAAHNAAVETEGLPLDAWRMF